MWQGVYIHQEDKANLTTSPTLLSPPPPPSKAHLEQYVAWCQVGVHDVLCVQVGQGRSHINSELKDVALKQVNTCT